MTTSTPTMGLTDKEAQVLQAFNADTMPYSLFDDGVKAGSSTWTAVFISEVEHVLDTTPGAASRIINKMIGKEYFDKDDSTQHDTDGFLLTLTDHAVDAIASFRADDELTDDLGDDIDLLDQDVEPGTPDDEVLDALAELDIEVDGDPDDDDDDDEPTTMVKAAGKKAAKRVKDKADLKKAALEDVKAVANRRTSHSDCSHEKSGSAGKTARAKCRKERAAKAKADTKAKA